MSKPSEFLNGPHKKQGAIYMKRILFLVVLTCGLALTASAQGKVDIFGYYTPVSATAAFKDIGHIHLAGNYGEQQTPKFYGLIRMRESGAADFNLLKPKLVGKKLTFTTKTVGGVYYTFVGNFTKLEDFPAHRPEGQTLLRGTLTKMRGKKKQASGTFNFIYSAGD
jgi:hypothetical protein